MKRFQNIKIDNAAMSKIESFAIDSAQHGKEFNGKKLLLDALSTYMISMNVTPNFSVELEETEYGLSSFHERIDRIIRRRSMLPDKKRRSRKK